MVHVYFAEVAVALDVRMHVEAKSDAFLTRAKAWAEAW